MITHEAYMQRCIDLARKGMGNVAPNPMVGCVIVVEDSIIGEGYHQQYGAAHAEVNAVNSVKDPSLLKQSTLYVSLEPCAHLGKTPPCADLIVHHQIPKVVIGVQDIYGEVSGKGIQKLKDAGIDVTVGILEKECLELNKRFFTFHRHKRPYLILKWAQTLDGFMGRPPESKEDGWITNSTSKKLVHKWRAEEAAILVGTQTALSDNPQLNVREFTGKDPLRIVLDRQLNIPSSHHVMDDEQETLVFTETVAKNKKRTVFHQLDFDAHLLPKIMQVLYEKGVQSLIIEGGRKMLDGFIAADLWDEARIFTGNKRFETGVPAPRLELNNPYRTQLDDDQLVIAKNPSLS